MRNEAIDILKGIGITLVLVAHSLEGFFSQFAYTFHMPLFFIVAGLFIAETEGTTSFYEWWKKVAKKDFKRLLLPAIFTIGIILTLYSLLWIIKGYDTPSPLSLIWNNNPDKLLGNIIILGNLWFLFALFFAKQAFYIVRQNYNTQLIPFVCIIVGAVAIIIGRWVTLPLCILVSISVLPFISGGYLLKHRGGPDKGIPNWFYLSIIVWIVYIFYGKLRIGDLQYSWGYVLDIVAASGGTLFFYQISKFLSMKTRYVRQVLSFLGTYSLILICAPGIETYCFPMLELIPAMPYRFVFVLLGKVVWCVLAVYACLKIPFLQNIFGVKTR